MTARARTVLHQRSDSETNELPSSTSTRSLAPSTVSRKTDDVSSWRSPASKNAENGSVSAATTRSNTVRSDISLESLPPVPPLRIFKQPSNLTPLEYRAPERHNLAQFSPIPVLAEASRRAPPRSILKRPPEAALPPYTTYQYQKKSSLWADDARIFSTPSLSRMNTHTLRLVDNGTAATSPNLSQIPKHEISQRHDDNAGSLLSGGLVRNSSVASLSRVGPSTTQLSAFTRQFPAWARYFYGKKGGRDSFIEPAAENEPEEPINATTLFSVSNTAAHDSLIIQEVDNSPHEDPESATLWSLPHLDHTPLGHLETLDRQVILFVIGFIVPLCWIIAAFLPLPNSQHKPGIDSSNLEAGLPEIEVRYENARWWRRINRVLSAVGLAIFGVIICLIVVATGAS